MMKLYNQSTRVDCMNEILSMINPKNAIGKNSILNLAAAFDTETSSFIDKADGLKSALCYAWMFGVEDAVIYGRTLEDFQEFMTEFNLQLAILNCKLITYVHNLKYDFQFIKKYFEWGNIFTKSRRDILYANLGNVEFRDSLVLAGGRSLAYIGKNLRAKGFEKAVGELDYSLIRTPITPLTERELHYCEMDIRVLVQYIREKIEDDEDITKIPYTNTGYVRRYVKNECFRNRKRYMSLMDELTMTPGCYQAAEKAFMGGATGPNIKYIGNTFTEPVTSYDIKSSYPYVMCTGYYPMSYGIPVPNNKCIEYLESKEYCSIFTLEVFNLIPQEWNDFCYPISESKCETLIGVHKGAGRVISAQYLKIICTELDLDTYKKFYKIGWDNMRISFMRVFKRGRLPKPIVKSVVNFFFNKTTLDGVKGKEAEYMISKNMLNAIYGMAVEKPVRPDFKYNNGIVSKGEIDYVQKVVEYNDKHSRFLFYPWGVWVTAQARWRLYDAIAECGKDFIYCDTDSVKILNAEKHQWYFERVNAEAYNNMLECAAYLHMRPSEVIPKSPKGKEKILGVWEKEWTAKRFKTIGPKRYLIEFENGECMLTAAGVNKEGALHYLINRQFFHGEDMFDKFNEGLIIPASYAKRLIATFIEEERSGWVTDYKGKKYYYRTPSGIHMAPSDYHFTIPDYTKEAIAMLLGDDYEESGQIE